MIHTLCASWERKCPNNGKVDVEQMLCMYAICLYVWKKKLILINKLVNPKFLKICTHVGSVRPLKRVDQVHQTIVNHEMLRMIVVQQMLFNHHHHPCQPDAWEAFRTDTNRHAVNSAISMLMLFVSKLRNGWRERDHRYSVLIYWNLIETERCCWIASISRYKSKIYIISTCS